jgi:aminomethyltransferase
VNAAPGTSLERYFAGRGVALAPVARGLNVAARFTDPAAEHLATRHAAGLFDFSFMGCAEISGCGSRNFIRSLQTRDLSRLRDNRLVYTLLLREDGTVLSDATVWQLAPDRYWLFVGRRDDLRRLASLSQGFDVNLIDRSSGHAVLAVQGSHAWAILCRCFTGNPPPELPYYGFTACDFEGSPCLVARIGYSGETGYELIVPAGTAVRLWEALLRAGADCGLAECGFEALDSLRIEAGHILFLRELAMPVTPFEIGLDRLLDFYRGPFVGSVPLWAKRYQTPRRRLVGLVTREKNGDALSALTAAAGMAGGSAIPSGTAQLTSVCLSPVFDRVLGLGFVAERDSDPGARVLIPPRTAARVVRLPFYDPAKFLPRRTR